jgi:ubiquinone/menaquinone biosynthesis C-methylase UbiE
MFAWFYASMYDRINARAEAAGLRQERANLLAHAYGDTLELGAGTGLNVEHYPKTLTSLTFIEPNVHMRKRLRGRVERLRPNAAILAGKAETLSFADSSFDTIVVTFVLCSVEDEDETLEEIARLLRPGGQLLFLEHVRDADPKIAHKQDHAPFLYGWMGCHPNRVTEAAIKRSKLTITDVRHGEVPKAPAIERPMLVGRAFLTAAGAQAASGTRQ